MSRNLKGKYGHNDWIHGETQQKNEDHTKHHIEILEKKSTCKVFKSHWMDLTADSRLQNKGLANVKKDQ